MLWLLTVSTAASALGGMLGMASGIFRLLIGWAVEMILKGALQGCRVVEVP